MLSFSSIPTKATEAMTEKVYQSCMELLKADVSQFVDDANCFVLTWLSEALYDELQVPFQSPVEGWVDDRACEWFEKWTGRHRYND